MPDSSTTRTAIVVGREVPRQEGKATRMGTPGLGDGLGGRRRGGGMARARDRREERSRLVVSAVVL